MLAAHPRIMHLSDPPAPMLRQGLFSGNAQYRDDLAPRAAPAGGEGEPSGGSGLASGGVDGIDGCEDASAERLDQLSKAPATMQPPCATPLTSGPNAVLFRHARLNSGVVSMCEDQTCRSTACSSSATVGGGAPRHAISMIAGGTRHATNKSARVPIMMDTPPTAPPPATAARTENQTPMIVSRFGAFDMMATLISFVDG
jgi:hypothetical protein